MGMDIAAPSGKITLNGNGTLRGRKGKCQKPTAYSGSANATGNGYNQSYEEKMVTQFHNEQSLAPPPFSGLETGYAT